jgi:ABC-2 type transport system permease protein
VSAGFMGPVRVKLSGLHSDDKDERASLTAFQAAGTGVMFLLFAMAGAGGAFLEEEESGTIERLLTSNIGMTRLLLSKWMFIALVGIAQVTLMFAWGSLPMFGIQLWSAKHFAGFMTMTIVTAAAAAGFGMMLATACRSRGQLSGISTIVILIMSAVGGSMVPRWAMSETIRQVGLATFNGWALDGYYKVFWYENAGDSTLQGVLRLWPQIAVLAGLTVAFLVIARTLARRWESV